MSDKTPAPAWVTVGDARPREHPEIVSTVPWTLLSREEIQADIQRAHDALMQDEITRLMCAGEVVFLGLDLASGPDVTVYCAIDKDGRPVPMPTPPVR